MVDYLSPIPSLACLATAHCIFRTQTVQERSWLIVSFQCCRTTAFVREKTNWLSHIVGYRHVELAMNKMLTPQPITGADFSGLQVTFDPIIDAQNFLARITAHWQIPVAAIWLQDSHETSAPAVDYKTLRLTHAWPASAQARRSIRLPGNLWPQTNPTDVHELDSYLILPASTAGLCAAAPIGHQGLLAFYGSESESLPSEFFAALPLIANHLHHVLEAGDRISQLQRQLATQRQQNQLKNRFMHVVEATTDFVAMLSQEGELLYLNDTGRNMLGIKEQPNNKLFFDLVPNNTAHTLQEIALPTAERDNVWMGETVLEDHLGRELPVSQLILAHKSAVGRVEYFTTIARDISAAKKVEEQLRFDASHDALTRLPNRSFFCEKLTEAIARARGQNNFLFAVLFLDLDRFKLINDSYGHRLGDRVLVEVGKRLNRIVRPADMVARLGGDEFTVLLNDIADPDSVTTIAQRINRGLSQPICIDKHELTVASSIGIACYGPKYTTPEDMLRDADTAMYRAKRQLHHCYTLFEPHMHEESVTRLHLEMDLRKAIENDGFSLVYQPIVDLADQRVVSLEALLRWQHPTHGLLRPDTFIPLAEETGLIAEIGKLTLCQACALAAQWQQQYPDRQLGVSVNLFSRQFAHFDLVGLTQRALAETGLEPQRLMLELTESAIIDAPADTLAVLRRLKQLGIRLALDDFGTGYSALSYLEDMPIDVIKIDKSFITRLRDDQQGGEIVTAILQMAHALGIEVLAEGIEKESHLTRLQRLACDYGQGYLFSRAMTPSDLHRFLAEKCDDPMT